MSRVKHIESDAPSDELSDQELVEQCQSGDRRAFDQLVLRHQQRALNVAYQLVRNQEDAMEVAQDAFVRAYRSIGEFRGDASFTTWLHQIVVNLARNKVRWWIRRGRDRTLSLDQPMESADGPLEHQVDSGTVGPDQTVAQRELVDRLHLEMGRLPRKYREILVLRNVNDMSYEEMAVVLKCSVGTIKSRMARAREALRQAMSRKW